MRFLNLSNTKEKTTHSFQLSEDIFDKLDSVAKKHNTTTVKVLKAFIKFGLVAEEIASRSDTRIIIESDNEESRELVITFD